MTGEAIPEPGSASLFAKRSWSTTGESSGLRRNPVAAQPSILLSRRGRKFMTGLEHSRRDILIVEDNAGDVLLVQESLTEGETRLHVAIDGLQALAFLRQQGKYADVPRPDLILLDLNLPKK